jgi:hypothetical protein
MTILSIKRLSAGLNNMRISLIGLDALAAARGAAVELPAEVGNWEPRPVRVRRKIALFELFDRDAVRAIVPGGPGEPDTLAGVHDCFAAGMQALRAAEAESRAARLLVALRATPDIRALAGAVHAWLRGEAGEGALAAVQLRIERDWIAHVERRKERAGWDEGMRMTNPVELFAKLRRTRALAAVDTLWACCDEGDLVQQPGELKAIAAQHGFRLLMKGDLPADIALPPETVLRSMLDYTLCLGMPDYIGLTNSTFSNNLNRERLWLGTGARHFAFDRPGDSAKRR